MTYKQTICVVGITVITAVVAVSLRPWFHHSVPVTASSLPLLTQSSPAVPADSALSSTGSTVPLAPDEDPGIPPLPMNATHVPDDYLLKLSAMVHLNNADERRISTKRWGRALPIAERLVQAPCDCEQRNWLNHFIAMGKAALAGMDEDYYQTAVLMQTMARNDQQLADHPELFAR